MKKAITKQAKPDYIDIDGDGNKKESMKEAAKSVAAQHKTNSWEEEDVKRGREQEEKGHKGHAQALFDDAHDSYNWKGGNDGHESWFHKFKKKNPVTQLKAPTKKFKDFDQMDTWDAKETAGEDSPAKQTPFQNLLEKYPNMNPSDTLAGNDMRMGADNFEFSFPSQYNEDRDAAFTETYGSDVDTAMEVADGDISEEKARKIGAEEKAKRVAANEAAAMKEKLYQEYLKSQGSAAPQNKTMAYKKSCAYRQDGHGESKGDQSATHTDYANYKGTDKGYHGKDGSSHGDQSATHRDYAHPIHKHMKR